jgi:DNA repair exonuclease SbcCD ATPase subunit
MSNRSTTAAADTAATPPTDRTPDDADGMSSDDEALLASALGLDSTDDTAASASVEAGDAQDLSQTSEGSPETGEAAAEESDDAEPSEGDDQAEQGDDAGEAEDAEAEKPKGLQGMQKRIDKLTAKLKAAQAEIEEIRTGKPQAAPRGSDPVESDAEVMASTEQLTKVSKDLDAVRELKARLRTDPKFVEDVLRKHLAPLPGYDPETMKEALDELSSNLRETAAKHRTEADARRKVVAGQVAHRREQVLNITREEMPWVSDEEDPRHDRYVQAMKDPFIASRPDASFFVAAGIEKLMAIEARQKQKGAKPAIAAKPAAVKVRPSASGVSAPPKHKVQDRQAAAASRFLESPTEDSLLEALEEELAAQAPAPRKR